MLVKQIVVVALKLLLIQVWLCHACWEDERLALFQLQNSFNAVSDLPYHSFVIQEESPRGKSANCCDWRRIACDTHTGRVTYLDLVEARRLNSRNWNLNASLFLPFKHLNHLDISSNGIIGCVENEGFERLKSLNNLEYLDLTDNSFTNNILASLSGLSSLKSLNIDYNNLKGLIYSEELAALGNLEELNLNGNKDISEFVVSKDDRVPANINTLYLDDMTSKGISLLLKSLKVFPNLRTLSLGQNNLTVSSFHNESQSFKNLENLLLDGSVVGDNFFRSLDALPSLKLLSYGFTDEWDNLQELAALGNLEELNLSGNKDISEFVASKDGQVPANINTLYLDELTFNGMPLLLKSLKVFPRLRTLSLVWNNLTVSSFHNESQSFKNLENLLLDGSIVGDNIFRSLDALPSLKSLSCIGAEWDILQRNKFFFTELCNLNHLQSLYLSRNNLSGELPPCLANFTSLQFLDLSSNLLVGNLSSSPLTQMTSIQHIDLLGNNFQIPISLLPFYNLSNLSHLAISDNELYAEIELHNLIPKFQLAALHMSRCRCGGVIPRFLYHQHNLQFVTLQHNKIMQGEFLHWLVENNTKLQFLDLFNNSLSGPIILPIHSHMNLRGLDISSNAFSGQIPTKIGSYFPSLEYLYIANNELNGSIPYSIEILRSLSYLDLSNNELDDIIPSSIGNLRSLSYLDFSNNHLSSEIPSSIGSMKSLEMLDISRNKIFGKLPIFFGTSYLTEVYLSKNTIHGSFLHAFHNCTQLLILDLSHNFLTDNISRWAGNFTRLRILLLGHNKLEGEIVTEMCLWDQLSFIDLSNNNVSGHIPTCLMNNNWYGGSGQAETMRSTYYRPVEITTKNNPLFYKEKILRLMSGIDLSCNNLTGQIPLELGNLNKLYMLNLSHNRLTGLIPSTFSNLEQIESLDLSYNNLEGNIPTQLTDLPFISSFSVAHNNLSGRIPKMVKQFNTFENGSYVGNPFLCGEPLSRSCTPKPPLVLPVPTTSNEKENGYIDMGTFYVSFAMTYTIVLSGIAAILYINLYWRRAWFYFIEKKMDDCYYFIVYDCQRFLGSKLSQNNP